MIKKLLMLPIIILLPILGTGQGFDSLHDCAPPLLANLQSCFNNNDVTGTFTGGGSTIYFQYTPGIPFGQVNSCVVQYNHNRNSCPTAPLVIIGSSPKTKKTPN